MPPVAEKGGREHEEFDCDDFMHGVSVSHCSAQIRNGFLRKVYALTTAQLLLTAAVSCLFMFHTPSRYFALHSPAMMLVTALSSFGLLFACHSYKNSHPLNLYLLGGFTLAMSYSVGVVCAMFMASGKGILVLQALLLTVSITVGLSAYTLRSKQDFSFLGAGLHGALGMLIVGSFLTMIVSWMTGGALFHGAMSFVLAVFGAFIFGGFMCAPPSRAARTGAGWWARRWPQRHPPSAPPLASRMQNVP
jgi:FtsH-binding integral membrane protein